ncbi:PQQ-dependent sugar dehydrogenase [Hymenobacter sp. ASUV-10]|uniref:PQQ-dependent sugar dehydrogenase n=1 Tax=Hymenobacter aranciens TaxID=3063996 RepID=A0ABT9BG65_9BACT|nr:PQQ-dependent sugar dehydrogenase [Hymenobacter sp. ASUV-10]MDO7877249.1 PQQ-dependent sugar dehydrogenase [Hymenobacter sp. ASUV-10]
MPVKSVLTTLLLAAVSLLPARAQLALQAVPVQLQNNLSFTLQIPRGHDLSVAAQGLERPRFFARAPDGRLFVTDLHNREDNSRGRVLLLDGWDEAQHRFARVLPFMENLRNPNQIVFHTANGKSYLYVAETHQLTMFDYVPGSLQPTGPGKVIARFPAYGLSYKYGGWHLTRSLTIHDNKLYVSIGSSCNACREKEAFRACIVQMNLDGSGAQLYATGLRNAVGLHWVGSTLWATNMGRDGLGPDDPQDVLTTIRPRGYYGWPYFYQQRQRIKADEYFEDSARTALPSVERPGLCGFAAHSAPLGLCYLRQYADTLLDRHLLVALHGSTTVSRQRGNEVVLITGRDTYVPVLTGFLQGNTEAQRYGRPCDVLQWNARTLLISDDKNGVIYCLWKK